MRISRRGRRGWQPGEPSPRSASEPLGGGDGPLEQLLAAAAAPPRPGELAGEEAALAAFRAARAAGPPVSPAPTRRGRGIRTGAGVWAAVVAATASAGVALAAGTRLDRTDPVPVPSQVTPAVPTPTSPLPIPPPTAVPGTSSTLAATVGGTADAQPARLGLCRAYLAKGGAERGRSLDTPAFSTLVEAAGGRDRVTAYCERILAAERHPGGGNDPGRDDDGPPGRDPSKNPGGGPRS